VHAVLPKHLNVTARKFATHIATPLRKWNHLRTVRALATLVEPLTYAATDDRRR